VLICGFKALQIWIAARSFDRSQGSSLCPPVTVHGVECRGLMIVILLALLLTTSDAQAFELVLYRDSDAPQLLEDSLWFRLYHRDGYSSFQRSTDQGQTWSNVADFPKPQSVDLGYYRYDYAYTLMLSVRMLDRKFGIAFGAVTLDRYRSDRKPYPIALRTRNGGVTWEPLTLPTTMANKLVTIAGISRKHWIFRCTEIGYENFPPGQTRYIRTDSGLSAPKTYLDSSSTGGVTPWSRVLDVSPISKGMVLTGWWNPHSLIRTLDSGQTWNDVSLPLNP
jgi:hypothetical protein